MPPESSCVRWVIKGGRIKDKSLDAGNCRGKPGRGWCGGRKESCLISDMADVKGRWTPWADLYNLCLGRKGLTFRKRVESIHSNWQSTSLGFEMTDLDKNSDSQNKRDLFDVREQGRLQRTKVGAAPSAPCLLNLCTSDLG